MPGRGPETRRRALVRRVMSVEVAGAMTIFFDIETVPPEESVRGRVLEEVKHEVKEGKLVLSANQQVDQVADERFRRLALCGGRGASWSSG